MSRYTSGEVRRFYGSRAWRNARDAYWQQHGGLCEQCLSLGLYTPGAQVHHIVPLTPDNVSDAAVSLSPANLQLLCESCHHAQHDPAHSVKPGRRRWSLDADGRVR